MGLEAEEEEGEESDGDGDNWREFPDVQSPGAF